MNLMSPSKNLVKICEILRMFTEDVISSKLGYFVDFVHLQT